MNPNGISHRLFVAALRPVGAGGGVKAAEVRPVAPAGPVKLRAVRAAQPFGSLIGRRGAEWSWSGWEHTVI